VTYEKKSTIGDHIRRYQPENGCRYPLTGRKPVYKRFCTERPLRNRKYVLNNPTTDHQQFSPMSEGKKKKKKKHLHGDTSPRNQLSGRCEIDPPIQNFHSPR
jgi:hypothetical protein